jgi:hypothetical protein
MKPESFCSFNIATFQLNVLCSPASTVLTAAAPPKGSVYGLWILHSGLYTSEFGKAISDTFFTVNCKLFFVHSVSYTNPNKSVILTQSVATREEENIYVLFNDTLIIDKITQTRTEKENVPRHNDEKFSNEIRGRNWIMDGNI